MDALQGDPQAGDRGCERPCPGRRLRAGLDVRPRGCLRERAVRPARGEDRDHPGAGGTQRWARSAEKVRAMEAVLAGEPVRAIDAERIGLVNRVVPAGAQLDEALRLANLIAARPPLAVRLGKEAVNQAMEVPLSAGLEFERKLFYLLFASDDKREGMRAFLEKRPGRFTGR